MKGRDTSFISVRSQSQTATQVSTVLTDFSSFPSVPPGKYRDSTLNHTTNAIFIFSNSLVTIIRHYTDRSTGNAVSHNRDLRGRRKKSRACRKLGCSSIHWTALFDNKYLGKIYRLPRAGKLGYDAETNTKHGNEKCEKLWWKTPWVATHDSLRRHSISTLFGKKKYERAKFNSVHKVWKEA
jgi:hypothetical protein